jgi:hypothetical protein
MKQDRHLSKTIRLALGATLSATTLLGPLTSLAAADKPGDRPSAAGHDEAKAAPEHAGGQSAATDEAVQAPAGQAPRAETPTGAGPEQPSARGGAATDHESEPAAPASPAAPAPEQGDQGEVAPGNRGTIKVHRTSTSDSDRRNEPRICTGRLVGFGFPEDAVLSVSVDGHGGPNAGAGTFATSIDTASLSDSGDFAIALPSLPDGMYKVWVDNGTAPGGAKQKVFKVDCAGTGDDEEEVADEETDLNEGGAVDDNESGAGTGTGTGTGTEGAGAVGVAVLGEVISRDTGAAMSATASRTPATPAQGDVAAQAVGSSTLLSLPRTGVEWAATAAMALGLIGLGTWLRRRSRLALPS